MRIDVQTIPFSGVATGGTLADINLQHADAFAILLEITAHGGTATATFPDLVPKLGAVVSTGAASDAIGTADLVNQTGLFGFSRIGPLGAAKTIVLPGGFWIQNTLTEARVRVTLTGAGHTITGNVHVLRRFK